MVNDETWKCKENILSRINQKYSRKKMFWKKKK
jgi:hypothetical protein